MTQPASTTCTLCHTEPVLFDGMCRRCYTLNIPLEPTRKRAPLRRKAPSTKTRLRRRAQLWRYHW